MPGRRKAHIHVVSPMDNRVWFSIYKNSVIARRLQGGIGGAEQCLADMIETVQGIAMDVTSL